MNKTDNVNRPKHYAQSYKSVECIDILERIDDPCLANAFKYIWRAGNKQNASEDLAKAQWYLNRHDSQDEVKFDTVDDAFVAMLDELDSKNLPPQQDLIERERLALLKSIVDYWKKPNARVTCTDLKDGLKRFTERLESIK